MNDPNISTSICFMCRVRWDFDWQDVGVANKDPRDCPSCGADAFFTGRVGDIGTSLQMAAAGLTIGDFLEHKPHQGRGGGE